MRGNQAKVILDRKVWRNRAKKFYKKQRAADAEIGRTINRLMQQLHFWRKQPVENLDQEAVKAILTEITGLRKEERFRDDFPTFVLFKDFLKKHDISLDELEEEDEV